MSETPQTQNDAAPQQVPQDVRQEQADQIQQNPQSEPKVFSEAYVKDLREEAASWRTKVRDLESQLKEAKTPEDFQKAVTEYSEQLHQRDVEIVALKHNIPEVLRDRLRGSTLEELEKDAQAIASMFANTKKVSTNTPSGGLDPNAPGQESLDPAMLAKVHGRRRLY